MKFLTVLLLSLAIAGCNAVNNKSNKELALEYLTLSGFKETIDASIDGYEFQLTKDATPEAKAQFRQLLTETLGWETTKEQLVEMIADTYTKDELDASIEFLSSPLGKSATAKNDIFAKKYAALVSDNMKKILAKCCPQK
jgi:hypothetical protein